MHEDLFGDGEPRDIPPRRPLVSHVPVPPITDKEALAQPTSGRPGEVRRALE